VIRRRSSRRTSRHTKRSVEFFEYRKWLISPSTKRPKWTSIIPSRKEMPSTQFVDHSLPPCVRSNYEQLNYHLYNKSAAPYPDLAGTHHGFFISDDIREELHRRSENVWAMPSQPTGLPEEVHNYHSLVPLEPTGPDRRKYFGHWATACYRATSTLDGNVYALRRVESEIHRQSHYSQSWSDIRPKISD
jgi:hypothetical protein